MTNSNMYLFDLPVWKAEIAFVWMIYTVSQKKNVHLFIFQITLSKIDRC